MTSTTVGQHVTPRRPPRHRRRLRRAVRRDQARSEAGERDFVVIEKRRRRRRHLARQHLPRRGLRRPEPALLASPSRPTPTGRCRSRRSPRSRPTSSGRAETSGTLDRFVFDTTVEDARWDDDAASAGSSHHAPADRESTTYAARTLISGAGGLSEPKLPDIEGIDDFERRALPLRPLGPRRRPHRQARRRHRHRRLGDPDRPGDPAAGRRTSTSTSAPRPG